MIFCGAFLTNRSSCSEVALVEASVVDFDGADGSEDVVEESLDQNLVVTDHLIVPVIDDFFEVFWHGFTGVKTGEDVSDESDLSQTEFFEGFLVAGDHSVGLLEQSVVETGDLGLTGGKTLSELSNDLVVEVFDSEHELVDLVDVATFGEFLHRFKFTFVITDSFFVHVHGVGWVGAVEVFSEDLNVVFVHFTEMLFPLLHFVEEVQLDLGSGFGELFDHFVDTSFGLILGFTTLWNKAFWEFNEDVSVVSTGAPSAVEVNSVAVVAVSGQHMEVVSAPVIV